MIQPTPSMQNLALPPAAQALTAAPGGSFERTLAERIEEHAQGRTIREESRKLVAEAFITPLLAKIRDHSKAAAPFGPTDAEKRFGPIFDRAVADSMSRPDRFPMIAAVERSIMQRIDDAAAGGAR